ncbi:hypothetical protein [Nocardia sp. NPDC050406]|uniref:hypothetical protein n=1 Tax=Nocardia sp. NPDC050406 TaxID=3364318 RepID=UPI003797DFC4
MSDPCGEHIILDLDANGDFLDPGSGKPVEPRYLRGFLARELDIPEDATDIVVFVHGWRNSPERAADSGQRLCAALESTRRENADRYPNLGPWSGYYVTVRWPSTSNPLPWGYRRIRDRAHAMTTEGNAAEALAHLLGYIDETRRLPGSAPVLKTAAGQYLHCVGHSFGGRFLVEAVQAAAESRPTTLGWNRSNPKYPYTVDTLVVFQMAAPPTIFADRLPRLLGDAPINGPIVVTHSTADRANGLWHWFAERATGVGYRGVREPADQLQSIRLRALGEEYGYDDFEARIVNVDANWRYRSGRFRRVEGAHSDFWYPESAHLILGLANLAR